MFMHKHAIGSALLMTALLGAPVDVWAKSRAVYAEFVTESDECISNEIFIHVRSSGNSTNAKISLTINKVNLCNEEQISLIKVDRIVMKSGGLNLDDNVTTATVSGKVTVVDKATRMRHVLKLNLRWRAEGQQVQAKHARDISELPSDEDEVSMALKHAVVYQDAIAEGIIDLDSTRISLSRSRGASMVSTDVR